MWTNLTSNVDVQVCASDSCQCQQVGRCSSLVDLAEITFLSGVSMYSRLKCFLSAFANQSQDMNVISRVDQTVIICKSNLRGTNANVSVCCRLSWSLNVGTVALLH